MLANLLDNPELVRRIGDSMRDADRGGATIAILLLAILTMGLTAHFVWRWRRRVDRLVDRGELLNRLAETLALDRADRRLLRRLADAAGVEPAAALVSESMLLHVLHRSERAGLRLRPAEQQRLGRVLDAVCAAAVRSAA